MNVGDRIRAARLAKGWTQPELSEQCGWGYKQGRVSHYESGRRKVNPDDMATIENALGLHSGALMGADGPDDTTEAELLAMWRQLPEVSRQLLLAQFRALVEKD